MHKYAIILAGGRGSRLPIAGETPKQFAPKFNDVTFVQDIEEMIVKAGQQGLVGKYSGSKVKLEDEEYTIVRQSDILAVIE